MSTNQNICTLMGYDATGNLITRTNALSQTNLTVYDAANRPYISVANWDGTPIHDPTDCQFPPQSPDTNLCSVTFFDPLGRRSATQNPLGTRTEFSYDGLGRVVSTTRRAPDQTVLAITSVIYDALGNRLNSADAHENETSFLYDSLNRLVETESPSGIIVEQTYDAAGRVVTTTNGVGNITTATYDQLNRVVAMTDGENNVTQYQFDQAGNQTAIIDAEGVRTGYQYDTLNRLVRVTENEQLFGPSGVDVNVVTQYQYNALGNRLVITNARAFTQSTTTYDSLNRPIQVEDALGNMTQMAYNALGSRTVVTDANGATTTFSYDGLNRLTLTSYTSDNEQVHHTYNAVGNRLQMVDNAGITNYLYDDYDRLISVTNPFTGTILYNYDLVGNRTKLTYPDGKVISYTYDEDNRLLIVYDGGTASTTYSYDDAGRLLETALPNGVSTTYSYDDANRLISIFHENDDDLIASYEYTLDKVGNRIQAVEWMLLPCPTTVNFTIMTAGADAILSWDNHTSPTAYNIYRATTPYFDPVTPHATVPYTTTSYTDTGVANSLTNHYYLVQAVCTNRTALPSLEKGEFTFAIVAGSAFSPHPPLSNPPLATSPISSQSTSFAPLSPPTQATTITYQYDALYRLTQATYTGTITATYTYGYDAVGNRMAYSNTLTQTTPITYTFDKANRLFESVEGAETTAYEWDNVGRLVTTTVAGVISRVYNYSQDGDMLTAIVEGMSTTYLYDGDGKRLQMSVAGDTTNYIWDYTRVSRLLYETGGMLAQSKHYLYGLQCLGELVDADTPDEEWRYYQRDGQNMVRQTTNKTAQVTLAWTFTPEGMVLLGEKGPVTHLDCGNSAIYDWSTGLIFKNGRFFDPTTGIWLTMSGIVVWNGSNSFRGRKENRRSRRFSKREKLFLLLLFLIVVLMMAGCSSDPTSVPPTPTPCPTPPPVPTPSTPMFLEAYFTVLAGSIREHEINNDLRIANEIFSQ
ncbi:MAG: RHS repeat protein, partial [Methylococcales bacterium]|nr:RHS repeat protein [Methylococcales bacterium]